MQAVARVTMGFMLASLLTGCGGGDGPEALTPGSGDKIAFSSDRNGEPGIHDGNNEIYVANTDGSGRNRLTRNPGTDWTPAWSPDGALIAFATERDTSSAVYIVHPDGTGERELIRTLGADAPTWSPDCAKIAFEAKRDGNSELLVIDVDGTHERRLTRTLDVDEGAPSWSPTGDEIAFVTDEPDGHVFVMKADGSGRHRISRGYAAESSPSWSPDGRRIAFERGGDVYVVNADGRDERKLTRDGSVLFVAWSPSGGEIAFTSDRAGGAMEIYVVRPDGSGERRLTQDADGKGNGLSWQPAADRVQCQEPSGSAEREPAPSDAAALGEDVIAFTSDRDGNQEIYVMNADGSGLQNLTRNPAEDITPDWSPDGEMIAFASDRDGKLQIFVMNADGSDQRRLTNASTDVTGPDWSPDGKTIAFDSDRDGDFEVYVMNADGSDVRQLTRNSIQDGVPDWSPDGRKIAFVSDRREGDYGNIYVMSADGSRQSGPLVRSFNTAGFFHWSPDGMRIAFTGDLDNPDVYVVNSDGSGRRRLTRNPGTDGAPTWSPDGARIAFETDRNGNAEIYVMNVDGRGQRNLTRNAAGDGGPAWRPTKHLGQ